MYNIPQRVEDDIGDPFVSSCSKSNHSAPEDEPLSHFSLRSEERHRLQSLFRVSEPEESSTNDCSTHKSSVVSEKQDEPTPLPRTRIRGPLPPDMAPLHDPYVPPELDRAVGNLHVCESQQYEGDVFVDHRGPENLQLPFRPAAVPPDLMNRGESRYNNFRNTNPYMYSLREGAHSQEREQQVVPQYQAAHYGQEDLPPPPRTFHTCTDAAYANDTEADTYLDMDR